MSKCRGCNAEIVWAKTQNGKNVPLDPRAIVYSVAPFEGNLIAIQPVGHIPGEKFMVSHFNTCPNANEFSGSKKEPAPERHFSEPQEVQ